MSESFEESTLFDTSAILKVVNQYRGFEQVEVLLEKVEQRKIRGLLCPLTFFEIVHTLGGKDPKKAASVLAYVENLGFDLLTTTSETAKQAAYLELKHKDLFLSLADCIILQSGIEQNATIVTSDKAWQKVEEAKVKVV
ncbi:MAG: PIN domain-containing protein [Candidatus Diapherotrites archaeon]